MFIITTPDALVVLRPLPSLVPRPSSRAVDPLPEKKKARGRPGKTYHATDITGRKEVERTYLLRGHRPNHTHPQKLTLLLIWSCC